MKDQEKEVEKVNVCGGVDACVPPHVDHLLRGCGSRRRWSRGAGNMSAQGREKIDHVVRDAAGSQE